MIGILLLPLGRFAQVGVHGSTVEPNNPSTPFREIRDEWGYRGFGIPREDLLLPLGRFLHYVSGTVEQTVLSPSTPFREIHWV